MKMWRPAINPCKLQSENRTFISVERMKIQTSLTDALGFMNVCYGGQVLNYGSILEKPTVRYETCEQVKYGWLVVGLNNSKIAFEVDWCFAVFNHKCNRARNYRYL